MTTRTARTAPRQLLFLCTGNYYRSRFAEILFNHLALQQGIAWRADSRGLGLEFGTGNVGPISQHALEHLKRRGIEPGNWNAGPPTVTDAEATSPFVRYPRRLTGSDLEQADHIVAMKEAEHRPLLARFQGWADRVEYWSVHDLDAAAPSEAMQELERLVRGLLRRLHGPTPSSEAA